jgi:hypothetical protein
VSGNKSKYIGALWAKDSGGNKFLSGEIEIDGKKTRIVIFKNNRKEKETHPDYNILLSDKQGGGSSSGSSSEPDTTKKKATEEEDDLPF